MTGIEFELLTCVKILFFWLHGYYL